MRILFSLPVRVCPRSISALLPIGNDGPWPPRHLLVSWSSLDWNSILLLTSSRSTQLKFYCQLVLLDHLLRMRWLYLDSRFYVSLKWVLQMGTTIAFRWTYAKHLSCPQAPWVTVLGGSFQIRISPRGVAGGFLHSSPDKTQQGLGRVNVWRLTFFRVCGWPSIVLVAFVMRLSSSRLFWLLT